MKNVVRVIFGMIGGSALLVGLFYRSEAEIKNRSDIIWLLSLLVAGLALFGVFWLGRDSSFSKRNLNAEERLQHNVQRVSSAIMVGFILISLQLFRQSFVVADEIEKPFEGTNSEGKAVLVQDPRLINQKLGNRRGRIFDASGKEVAGIATSKYNLVRRTYDEQSPVKQLLGYFSPLHYGNSGLEEVYDDYLSGSNGTNPFLSLQRSILNQPTIGNDLYLTIDPKLQQIAQDALGNQNGSVVLLDAKSGAVLAMVGYPRYNPADLTFDPTVDDSLWNDQIQEIQKRWTNLNSDPTLPLLHRPTRGLYVPGSIFKTVTLAAMLDTGKTTPQTVWEDKGFLIVDGHRINDPNRPRANQTNWTSREGYMFSLNTVFALMGIQLGQSDLENYAAKFGFGKKIPFDLSPETSRAYSQENFLASKVAQADTGFGQGQLLMTPLHAALIAAAIGREDGVLPKPYLVQQIKTASGALIKEAKPEQWLQAVRPETAKTVRDIMVASATEGWVGQNGGSLPRTGATVGGKTGTAELGGGINNGWYIAWASKGDRLFSIAVVIDNKVGGEGLRDAMPRANQVLTAALATVK